MRRDRPGEARRQYETTMSSRYFHGMYSLLALVALLVASCGGSASSTTGPAVKTNGTVTFQNIEGGCWSIVADDGTKYQSVHGLAADLKTEGLRVYVEGNLPSGWGGICPGTFLEITLVQKL